MFSESYQQDFAKWRAGRAAWKSLIAAVRAEKSVQELCALGAEAGADAGEVGELKMIFANARQRKAEAAAYPKAQRELDRLDAGIERLKKVAEKASADTHPAVLDDLQAALNARQRYYNTDVCGPMLAHNFVSQVAQPMGLA